MRMEDGGREVEGRRGLTRRRWRRKEGNIPHNVFTSSTVNSNPALLIDMTAVCKYQQLIRSPQSMISSPFRI